MAQLEILKQALRLDSEADHEIEWYAGFATGVCYIAVGDNGACLGLRFRADVVNEYIAGNRYEPATCEIIDVSNVNTFIDYTYEVDESDITSDVIAKCLPIVEAYIYSAGDLKEIAA